MEVRKSTHHTGEVHYVTLELTLTKSDVDSLIYSVEDRGHVVDPEISVVDLIMLVLVLS